MKIKKLFPIIAAFVIMCGCEYEDYDNTIYPDFHQGAERTGTEEELYQVIYDHLSRFDYESIKIYGYPNNDDIFRVARSVIFDHPELFWVDDSGMSASYPNNCVDLQFRCISDGLTVDKIKEMCAEVSEEAYRIKNNVPKDSSDWEKILFVHDEIVKNSWFQNDDLDDITDTMYGCLVKGRSQSRGYAQAFQYIMELMGYECGMFYNNGHTWNYIRLDGKYYWLDLAYDDPNFEVDVSYNFTHNYFMCDDEHFSVNHDLSKGGNRFVPKCDSFDNYYYVVDGSYLSGYDASDIADIISKHNEEEQVELKFTSSKAYHDAIDELEAGNEISTVMRAQKNKDELSYWMIDEWNIIKIILVTD